MWSPETKQALMARGNIICFDSLGSSEGVGFAGSINAPGSAPDDRQVHDRREHEGVHRRRTRGRARLRRDRHARGRRPHPGRLLQGRAQVGGDVPHDQRRALVGARRLRTRRSRQLDRAARPRLGRDQLGRREGVPRRGRGSGEAAPDGRPTASWWACPTTASAKPSPRSSRARPGATRHRRATSTASLESLARYKRPAPVRVRSRDRARPERQGRLQVGQGAGRATE